MSSFDHLPMPVSSSGVMLGDQPLPPRPGAPASHLLFSRPPIAFRAVWHSAIRLEVDDIGERQTLIGDVGEGRIEVRAVRRHAELHRIDEVEERPLADAVVRIRRDVGRVERTEGRGEGASAGELEEILAPGVRRRVTRLASAGLKDVGAVGEVGLVVGQVGGGERLRGRQEPACRRNHDKEHQDHDGKLADHREHCLLRRICDEPRPCGPSNTRGTRFTRSRSRDLCLTGA